MNRSTIPLFQKISLAVLFLLTLSPFHQAIASGNLDLFLGFKAMNKDDWDPVQAQGEGGLLLDFKGQDWPISIALDFLGSRRKEAGEFFVPGDGLVSADWEGRTSEFNGGVRKYWGSHKIIHPYIGGGLAFISAQLEAKTGRYDYVRDSDYGVGLWFNSGVTWTLSNHFNIGFDIRLSGAEVTIFDEKRRAGGFHSGLVLGYHW
jgi:hypothetical protein